MFKKIISAALCAAFIASVPVPALAANLGSIGGVRAAELRFAPDGGGKFIYCNNNEGIMRAQLADSSNPSPEYIMKNTGLSPDKYSMYLSFINRTDTRFQTTGAIDEQGFDVELDVQLAASKDAVFKINALGYYVTGYDRYYTGGALAAADRPWSCLSAVADYTQRPIYQQNSSVKYIPEKFTPKELKLSAGRAVWLSDYIENYCAVPWLKAVHLLADIEIVSGTGDINIAAVKSTPALRDRSAIPENAAPGKYYRDRQYKGIADTLPSVTSNELSYKIDNYFVGGTLLPVTIFNQFQPEGNTTTKWFTNLNPQEDIWSRDFCTESDMLGFTYKDDSKLGYYGSSVADSDKDNVWKFDVFHSDTTLWDGAAQTGYSEKQYLPNYPLTTTLNNSGYGCNLGNYGVKTNYRLSLENTSGKTRYFNYLLKTTADNLVNIKDENGKYITDYTVTKGQTEAKVQDTLACVELPAGETTKFTVEVSLPTNCAGGMENSFSVTDAPTEIGFTDSDKPAYLKPSNFTGSEYYKWEGESLYTSADNEAWTPATLYAKTLAVFSGRQNNYEIRRAGNGYTARCSAYLDAPSLYSETLKYFNNVYFLDENFNVTGQHFFDRFPTAVTYAKGKYYVKTRDGSFCSPDGINWQSFGSGFSLPLDNGGAYAVSFKEGRLYVTSDGITFKPVSFPDKSPVYADIIGKYYYYAADDCLYLSENGIFWEQVGFGEKITSIDLIDGDILVNEKFITELPEFKNDIILDITGDIILPDSPPVIENDRTLVPFRAVLEKLGAEVSFSGSDRTVTAVLGGTKVKLTLDSDTALVNGASFTLDAPAEIKSDRTYVPIRFIAESLGFDVGWNAAGRIITVSKRKTDAAPGQEDAVSGALPSGGLIPNELAATAMAKAIVSSIEGDGEYTLTAALDGDTWTVRGEDGAIVMTIKKSNAQVSYYSSPKKAPAAAGADDTL